MSGECTGASKWMLTACKTVLGCYVWGMVHFKGWFNPSYKLCALLAIEIDPMKVA